MSIYEQQGKPWYQHTLSDGIQVDEAYPGQFYVVGHGTQPDLNDGIFGAAPGVMSLVGGGRTAASSAPPGVSVASSAETSRVIGQPSSKIAGSGGGGVQIVRSPAFSTAVAKHVAAVNTRQVGHSALHHYDLWAKNAPGDSVTKVAPGVPAAPPPKDGGSWRDYVAALDAELKALSYFLPKSGPPPWPEGGTIFGVCDRDKVKYCKKTGKSWVYGKTKCDSYGYRPDLFRCAWNSIRRPSSVWTKKLKAAFAAAAAGGQNPLTIVGALRVQLWHTLQELRGATYQWALTGGDVNYIKNAVLPSQDEIRSHLMAAYHAYRNDLAKAASGAAGAKVSPSRTMPGLVRIPGAGTASPGVRLPGISVGPGPGGGSQAAAPEEPRCPEGYYMAGREGDDILCAPEHAGEESAGESAADPSQPAAKGEAPGGDTGKYLLYGAAGVALLGGLFIITKGYADRGPQGR